MTILLAIIGLSLLILLHEAGHFFVARLFGMKVDEFGFGFPPKLFSKKRGDTEYTFNLLPFGGFVRIAGEVDRVTGEEDKLYSLPEEEKKKLFLFQPAWKRSLVILAGVVVNFLIGWIMLSSLLMIGSKPIVFISSVENGSPAEVAGVKAGDVVLGYPDSKSFVQFINENKGKEVKFNVIRNGSEEQISATPRAQTSENQGALGVGIGEGGIPKYGFFKAFYEGLKKTGEIAWMTVDAFIQLFRNLFFKAQLLEGVVGPLGIFGVAHETGKIGMVYLVQLIALISVNLAIMNLIPFPALDGGRFVFILIEKIKGSPVSPKIEGLVNAIGFVILLILIILVSIRDVANLF